MTEVLLAKDDLEIREIAVATLERADLARQPTADELAHLQLTQALSMGGTRYKLDRQLRDVSLALGVSNNALKKSLAGKRVLDIGCGNGAICEEIAKDKSTSVIGIDIRNEFLSSSLVGRNLTFEWFSGYEAATFHPKEFDVAMSIYSHAYWVKNGYEAQEGIRSTIDATKVGGTAIFVPILKDVTKKQAMLEKAEEYDPRAIEALTAGLYMSAVSLQELFNSEANGEITCAFRASGRNQPNGGHESFSVIAQVLDK